MVFLFCSMLNGVANAPQKPKTRGHQARVGAQNPMPTTPLKVNFSGQMPDLTPWLEQVRGGRVFPGENRRGLLIPDSPPV